MSEPSANGRPVQAPAGDEGRLGASRDAPVGGQAVLEGVMMRGVSTWAVAVRKPVPEGEPGTGEIEITSEPLVSWTKRHRLFRIPVVRGVDRKSVV